MFLSRNKKNNVYPCKPQFYSIKVGFKGSELYRHVFEMETLPEKSPDIVYLCIYLFSLCIMEEQGVHMDIGLLTHCILNRLSHTIYWKSAISILGTSGMRFTYS